MSDNYEQPVEPMSRAEDILRGNTSTVPMSRIEALLKQIIEGGGSSDVFTPFTVPTGINGTSNIEETEEE